MPLLITALTDWMQRSTFRTKINENFTNVKNSIEGRVGFFDYNDLTTQSTPINIPATSTYVYLTNDTAWPNTLTDYAPLWITDIWDEGINAFDFSQLKLGDMVDIRADIIITTSSPNQVVNLALELASWDPIQYDIQFVERLFKTAWTYQITVYNWIYIGNEETRTNPWKFKVKSDGVATVKVNGWYCQLNIHG